MADIQGLVIVGPGLGADPDLLGEVAATEFAALGVPGRLIATKDAAGLRAALRGSGGDGSCALVVAPGPEPDARRLMAVAGSPADRAVWLDLGRTGPVPVADGATHLYGRGLWGLTWAIRHAVHRLRRPARRIAYGTHPDQWGELRLPAPSGSRPPVAVLVHGGYWRSFWGADLMDALAIDLADRGFVAWNLEYRRPDRHGWDATAGDVATGLAALHAEAEPTVDSAGIAVIGHSAGGQLALRAAADDTGRVALVVSLAGVVDLVEAERRGMGTGAVAAALGGTPAEMPGSYAGSDPMVRLPLGVPQLVVQGRDDDLDLVDLNRRYVRAARAAADPVVHLELPGDHFAVIDPSSDIWRTTADQITHTLLD